MSLNGPAPRVFALPPGVPFARHFAQGFHARFSQPETIGRTVVLVNTRRALRAIEDALAELAPGPGLLPRLGLMSELFADPLATDLPPAISPLRRQLRLTRLVEHFLATERRAGEIMAPARAAPDLAEELALLVDRFCDEGLAADCLDGILDGSELGEGAAAHWQRTLRFVDIVRHQWPAISAELEGGAPDPRQRQRAAVAALAESWRADPPTHPVIVAGSTGSVGSTRELMAAVAGLPQGAVVLPGFDPAIEPAMWEAAGPEHPAGIFRPLLGRLGVAPGDVQAWQKLPDSPRRALFAQALRPAPVTDHWREAAADLAGTIDTATAGLALVEADSPRHEAEAIAVAIREALETPGATVGLVSPDAGLARRVTAALDRFSIVPDDTLGQALALAPPAVLLRLTAAVAAGRADAVQITALLQHPLVRPGMARAAHLAQARRYEARVLRGTGARAGAGCLPAWAKAKPEGVAWLAQMEVALAPLAEAITGAAPLGATVAALRASAGRLTDAGNGPEIWAGPAGQELDAFTAELERHADAFGEGPVGDFPALLLGLMRGRQVRPSPERPHPRVAIWGPREARVQAADLMILAGLNDGVWPAAADPGPWLSRPMHAAIGLPLPERTVGLAAHDFLQGACQGRALLTRARKVDGVPTVASRWLVRLETLVEGIGAPDALRAMRARGGRYLGLAERLGRPEKAVPPAARPRPTPPLDVRPRRLSVTDIERLIRDAYAIYAKHVLRLRPLEPLGRPPDARERGSLVHRVMEKFTARTSPWPGVEAARGILLCAADEILADEVPWPDLRRTWRARIARFADWFVESEEARRQGLRSISCEVFGRIQIDLAAGPFEIRARADRIDAWQDGRAAIYDYKTGQPPSKGQVKAGFAQQIHLQAAMLAQGGFDGLPAMQTACGAYIGLTGSGDGGRLTEVDTAPDQIEQHIEGVVKLLSAYDAGAPYVALGRVETVRTRGDYDHLARRDEWWGAEE